MIEVAILLGALVLMVVAVVIVQRFILKDSPSPAELSSVDRNESTPNLSILRWSEVTRGNKTVQDIIPPCFDVSVDAQNVYKVLTSSDASKYVIRHMHLLDAISVLLCQTRDTCKPSSSKLKDRIFQLLGTGANSNDAQAKQQVAVYIGQEGAEKDTLIVQFLIAAVHKINTSMAKLQEDSELSVQEKELIMGHVNSMMSSIIKDTYQRCS